MLLTNIQPKGQLRRWYDQDRGCTRLLLLLNEMSQPELRQAAARLLMNYAQRVLDDIRAQSKNQPNSMGLPAIREKYMTSQYARRQYDRDDLMKKAHGLLYNLPIPGLTAVGFHLTDTFEMLVIYSFACERLHAQPDPKEVLNIMRVGLYEGLVQAQQTLAEYIGQDLYDDLAQEFRAPDPVFETDNP